MPKRRRLSDEELFRIKRDGLEAISDETINRRLDGLEAFRRARRQEKVDDQATPETVPVRRPEV